MIDPLLQLRNMMDKPARTRDKPMVFDTYEKALVDAELGTEMEQATAIEDMAHAATLPIAEAHPVGSVLCQRCEVLPRPPAGRGALHLNMPLTHTLGKVLTWLAASPLPHSRREGTVVVEVGDEGPGPTLTAIAGLLASTEIRDTRALFQPAGHLLQSADYFRIESLATLLNQQANLWLLEMMRDDRLTSFFQPIADADGRSIHAYECLMRGERDGAVVMPGAILEAARQSDLLFQVDMAGRRAAIRQAVACRLTACKVFVNFTPNAIYDPKHCLDSTVRMVDAGGLDHGQVVFEVTEAERLPDMPHLQKIVDFYRDKGFGVALDDVGAGYASLSVLLGLKPDYIKLDMGLIRGVDADPAKAVVVRKLIEASREMGLKTIAEGIETEAEWDWVRRHGADFVQGYLFAKPGRVPPRLNTV